MADCSPEAADWDRLCKKCGSCCFEKIEDQRGNIFYMQSACRFLDIDSRRCKIFERRFEINPGCVQLTPELVQSLRWLPRNCGYRRKIDESVTATRKNRKR
ncbi:MAG: YkgJ family cysteine cluster protein [Desulfuromonadaceae bacterium]